MPLPNPGLFPKKTLTVLGQSLWMSTDAGPAGGFALEPGVGLEADAAAGLPGPDGGGEPAGSGPFIPDCEPLPPCWAGIGIMQAPRPSRNGTRIARRLPGSPARGSLCRAAGERLGVPALILETTKNEQPLESRVAQHELMVRELLSDLSMLARAAHPGEPS